MDGLFFKREFPSSLDALRDTVDDALKALETGGWIGPDQHYHTWLCLEEALVNAVVHGNRNDPRRSVSLEMIDEGDRCRILVRDEGDGFRPESIHKPAADAMTGRGVFLMKCFMKGVTFNESERCLEMVLPRKGLSEGGSADE